MRWKAIFFTAIFLLTFPSYAQMNGFKVSLNDSFEFTIPYNYEISSSTISNQSLTYWDVEMGSIVIPPGGKFSVSLADETYTNDFYGLDYGVLVSLTYNDDTITSPDSVTGDGFFIPDHILDITQNDSSEYNFQSGNAFGITTEDRQILLKEDEIQFAFTKLINFTDSISRHNSSSISQIESHYSLKTGVLEKYINTFTFTTE